MAGTDSVKYGCVRFDDTHRHDKGWAAIAGDKAFRIACTRDLSSEVIWLTNLEYEAIFAAGMENHAGFRRSDYLAEHFLKKPSTQAGVDNSKAYCLSMLLGANYHDGSEQVTRMAMLFDRLIRLGKSNLHFNEAPQTALHKGVREHLLGFDPVVTKLIHDAVNESTVSFVMAERDGFISEDAQHFATLTMPRATHGIMCSNVSMPTGQWSKVASPPNNENQIAEWLDDIEEYCLVQFTIENINPNAYRLINFGSGRKAREWATGMELALLNKLGRVRIKQAYKPAELTQITPLIPLFENFEPIHELSLSVGMFWQNIWIGLCADQKPPPYIRRGQPSINTLKPFVRSIDHNLCFMKAMRLQEHGFPVSSYGKGKVTVSYDGNESELADLARSEGLIPTFLKQKPVHDVDIDTPVKMLQEIYIQGDFDGLNDADLQIVDHICQKDTPSHT